MLQLRFLVSCRFTVNIQEFSERRLLLAGRLAESKLDALLVSSGPNIRYLSGFTGSNGLLYVSADGGALFTDPRYELQAAAETGCDVRIARDSLAAALGKWLRRAKVCRIGFEPGGVTVEAYQALKTQLPARCHLESAGSLIEEQRMWKSPAELEAIRHSVAVNSAAFSQTVPLIRPGMTESELATELEYRMRRLGAEKPAFETIVASGERSALPHAQPSDRQITRNELLLIDMGASVNGYASDMTRMLFLGRPAPKVRRLYKAVLRAQLAAIAAVREGVTAGHVDRVARGSLRAASLDRAFVHSTGHGLGLEIHEPPRLGRGGRTRLRAGMAITIEPGVYLQGFGGIRIEDTVVVTRNGCEMLTPTSKELLAL